MLPVARPAQTRKDRVAPVGRSRTDTRFDVDQLHGLHDVVVRQRRPERHQCFRRVTNEARRRHCFGSSARMRSPLPSALAITIELLEIPSSERRRPGPPSGDQSAHQRVVDQLAWLAADQRDAVNRDAAASVRANSTLDPSGEKRGKSSSPRVKRALAAALKLLDPDALSRLPRREEKHDRAPVRGSGRASGHIPRT